MKKQFSWLILTLLISLLLSAGTCSATGGIPLDEVHEGIVSGGVYFDSYYGFGDQTQYQPNTVVESFTLPEDTEGSEWAMLLVSVYCGSMTNDYKGYANVSFGNTVLGNESLSINFADTSENVNRVTSDYVICYDVTDLVQAGENIATVKTGQIDSNFDGRIKLVTLVAAYNDSSEDNVWYQVNQGIEPANGSTDFDVDLTLPSGFISQDASLTSVYLASSDGIYTLNGESLSSGVPQGDYSGSNVWNVTDILDLTETNTMTYNKSGYYKIVLGILSAESQEESTATADLNISDISVFHNSYEGAWEDLNNTVNVTVRNEGDDVVNDVPISFYEDGMEIESKNIAELSSGAETVVSFTWKPDDSKTYTMKAIVDPDITINDVDRTNNEYSIDQSVLHNGYMGDKPLTTYVHGTIRGNISYDYGDSTYKSGLLPDESYTVNHAVSLPEGGTVKLARLYTYWTWSCIGVTGAYPEIELDINGNVITTEDEYNDTKGWGSYSDIPSGMWAYNVTEYVTVDGDYLTTITNTNSDSNAKFSISGVALLVIYEDPNGQEIEYWINEGADMISTKSTSGGLISEEATTTAFFEGNLGLSEVESAKLWTIVQSGNDLDNILYFNDMGWSGVFDGTPYNDLDIDEARTVEDYLKAEDNVAQISAVDAYSVSCGAILVVESTSETDLIVSGITTNSGEIFANEANTISAKIENTGTADVGSFTVMFEANEFSTNVTVDSLSAGANTTLSITDPTIRAYGENVDITVTVDSKDSISETDETNNDLSLIKTVGYNGYKGKRWTDGSDISTQATFEGRYGLVYSAGNTSYTGSGWTEKTYNWTASDLLIPDGATVVSARLYQPYTYNKMGIDPAFAMSFNGNIVTPDATYTDQKSFGSYNYPYGLYAYNVTSFFNSEGNSITLTPEEGNTYGIYGAYMVVVYSDSETSVKKIWINEEFDMIYCYASYSVTSEEATAYAPFMDVDTTGFSDATAIAVLASAGDEGKSRFFFNDEEYTGFWTDYDSNPQVGFSSYDVSEVLLSEENTARFQSFNATKGDNMYAMNAILVVEYPDPTDLIVSSITPNSGEIFANEANTISAKIENTGTSDAVSFTVSFDVNGFSTNVTVDSLSAGENTTLSVTDPTIRVYGENVDITVTVDSEDSISETDETNNDLSLIKTVVYNGYKGKRWTDGSDISTQATFEGRYGLVYSAGNTSYAGSGWTEKTYNWTASDLLIPDGATVVSARLYQPYTYNKMGVDPAFAMSFNGNIVNPDATYTDQKSFGSYNYPYGLYAYNVTSFFNSEGNNITLTPEEGNTYGIYGAYMIVVYSDPETSVKEIWINEEFDMLYCYASYSVTSEEATAYAPFQNVDTSGVSNATAIAILASAGDDGKSRFFFNDEEYTGFWTDYNSNPQVGFSSYNVSGALLSGENTARFQSYNATKGDNMYAMNAILVLTIDDSSEVSTTSGGSSGGSSSGSSSGGGGGSTGEKYENILVKDVESVYIYKDTHIVYEFSEEGNAISSVQFDGLKNSGSIKTIVEVLKARSSFADTDAPGEVYQQMNIWVGNTGFVSSDNVENLEINFKVEKSWLEENNIDKDNVNLYRYSDDSWNLLSTTITDEDDTYVYFKAETPGFSPFAIAGTASVETVEDSDTSLYSTEEETIDSTVEAETDAETSSALPGFEILLAVAGLAISGLLVRRKFN
jgi:PGF-pre-PGF domain-containing protein